MLWSQLPDEESELIHKPDSAAPILGEENIIILLIWIRYFLSIINTGKYLGNIFRLR